MDKAFKPKYFSFIVYIYMFIYFSALCLGQQIKLAHPDPEWFSNLGIVVRACALIAMFFYLGGDINYSLFKYYNQAKYFFKVFPFILVFYDVLSWYCEAYVFDSQLNKTHHFLMATIITYCFVFPSWYICFKFGYVRLKN